MRRRGGTLRPTLPGRRRGGRLWRSQQTRGGRGAEAQAGARRAPPSRDHPLPAGARFLKADGCHGTLIFALTATGGPCGPYTSLESSVSLGSAAGPPPFPVEKERRPGCRRRGHRTPGFLAGLPGAKPRGTSLGALRPCTQRKPLCSPVSSCSPPNVPVSEPRSLPRGTVRAVFSAWDCLPVHSPQSSPWVSQPRPPRRSRPTANILYSPQAKNLFPNEFLQ